MTCADWLNRQGLGTDDQSLSGAGSVATLEIDMPSGAGPKLQTVRGLRYYLEKLPLGDMVPALIRGVVTRKWARGSLRGYWVLELTGQINVVVDRRRCGLDMSGIHVGNRVIVTGDARLSDRGHLVLEPTSVDTVPEDSFEHVGRSGRTDEVTLPAYIVTNFLLARLRSIASQAASSLGYRQFEPSYLSTPLEGGGVEPLHVSFEGWGSTLSLAVSPAPQLLQILLETGEQHVFAVGRCFTSSYRDGFSSAEELVLVARQINISIQDAANFAVSLLRRLLEEEDTAIGHTAWLGVEWPSLEVENFLPRSIEIPQIEWMQVTELKSDSRRDVFRVVYPPGVAVAEGDVAKWSENLRIGGVMIHLERLVSLLSPSRLAEIRHLGDPLRGKSR